MMDKVLCQYINKKHTNLGAMGGQSETQSKKTSLRKCCVSWQFSLVGRSWGRVGITEREKEIILDKVKGIVQMPHGRTDYSLFWELKERYNVAWTLKSVV